MMAGGARRKVVLTEEQEAYLKAHINDTSRTAIARTIGVTMQWVSKYAQKHGGKMRRHSYIDEDRLRQLYPDYWDREIADIMGVEKSTVSYAAQRLGLKHSEACLARRKQHVIANSRLGRAKVDWAAVGKKRKLAYKLEYIRMWSGLKRKTNYKLRMYPVRVWRARHYLMTAYGYKPCADNFYTLIRPVVPHYNEKRYIERYGLKFIDEIKEEEFDYD